MKTFATESDQRIFRSIVRSMAQPNITVLTGAMTTGFYFDGSSTSGWWFRTRKGQGPERPRGPLVEAFYRWARSKRRSC